MSRHTEDWDRGYAVGFWTGTILTILIGAALILI